MVAWLMAVVVGLGVAAGAAAQGTMFAVNQECEQLKKTPDHSRLRCIVGEDRILRILVLTKYTDPKLEKDRAQYLMGVMSRNYYAGGGKQVAVRMTDKDGKAVERYCFSNGRCGDWLTVGVQPASKE